MSDTTTQTTENTTAEENFQQEGKADQSTNANHWDAIRRDFQNLGQSIASAVKDMWQDDKCREQLGELRSSLENIGNQVGKVVDEAVDRSKAKNVKAEAQRAVDEVKDVGGKVYTETKPHLVYALKTLDDTIQKVIARLEHVETQSPTSPSKTEDNKTV